MTAPWGNLGIPGHLNLDSEWQGLLSIVGDPPAAQLRQTVSQSPATATFTPITFTQEDHDNYDGHDNVTNTSRYTCQVAGRYMLAGKIGWAANATGQRAAAWYVNGTNVVGGQAAWPAVAAVARQFVAPTLSVVLAVNDYVELQGYQDSGGALATDVAFTWVASYMYVRWVGLT